MRFGVILRRPFCRTPSETDPDCGTATLGATQDRTERTCGRWLLENSEHPDKGKLVERRGRKAVGLRSASAD